MHLTYLYHSKQVQPGTKRKLTLNQQWADYLTQETKTSRAREAYYRLKTLALSRDLGIETGCYLKDWAFLMEEGGCWPPFRLWKRMS